MDNPHTIDRIMAGDIPPLEEVTPKQLSALVTLLQTFHLGRAMGQNNTPKEAEYDLFQQLVLLKDTLSDKTRRTSAHSDAKRPVIPIQSGHRFRFNPAAFFRAVIDLVG